MKGFAMLVLFLYPSLSPKEMHMTKTAGIVTDPSLYSASVSRHLPSRHRLNKTR